jgi:type I site-specific restriction-modification system R (restriction) subunit
VSRAPTSPRSARRNGSPRDGATVHIYYESRLARLALEEAERPKIDPDFEEATEGEEVERKEKLKTRWAQLEAIVGAEKRLRLVARDIVQHALETNDSAVKVLGDETLRTIARELVRTVRANVTIDWTVRENVRAHLRVLVKRILRKYGYPPDKQDKATQTVLEQAEVLSPEWATA